MHEAVGREIKFRAMNCQMFAFVECDSSEALAALEQLPGWFEGWEQCLSRFRSESELCGLNRNTQAWKAVSETMWEVLNSALEAAHTTAGIVTPTLLSALEAAGYDRSFQSVPLDSLATTVHIGLRPTVFDWRDIELDSTRHRVHLPAGMQLDLGGIAKGWAADQAAQRLACYGPALVDAGGDIAIANAREVMPIGVANPFSPDDDLEVLMLRDGGVATSGRDYRRWRRGNLWQHHIIDPRTGQPAHTDVLSATVVASSAQQAEAAAKCALILGSDEGLAWMNAHEGMAALLALDDGRVLLTHRLEAFVWKRRLELA